MSERKTADTELTHALFGNIEGMALEDAANLVSALEQWHAAQHARERGRHPLMHCSKCGELVLHDHECKPNSPAEAVENDTMADAGTLPKPRTIDDLPPYTGSLDGVPRDAEVRIPYVGTFRRDGDAVLKWMIGAGAWVTTARTWDYILAHPDALRIVREKPDHIPDTTKMVPDAALERVKEYAARQRGRHPLMHCQTPAAHAPALVSPEPRLLRDHDAARLAGIGRSLFLDLVAKGAAPESVRLGQRMRRWDRHALEAWIAAGCPKSQGANHG